MPSEAELKEIEAYRKAFIALLEEERENGQYVIELAFSDERSTWHPFHGVVTFWHSGLSLGGNGARLLYVCPACSQPIIEYTSTANDHHVCIRCNTSTHNNDVYSMLGAKITATDWANLLTKWVGRLKFDCDIKLLYSPNDLRSVAIAEQERDRGGDLYNRHRRRRASASYNFKSLIRDSNAKGELGSCIRAFLVA
jgi:hypothetical protein